MHRGLLRGADHLRTAIETTPIDFMAYGFSNRRRLEGLRWGGDAGLIAERERRRLSGKRKY